MKSLEAKNKANAINYFTRNKHSDYPEVVFSSILSNLLDPEIKYVFERELLEYFFTDICKFNINPKKSIVVKSEHSLGERVGNVDVYCESDDYILAIEVKIWDRSAKNTNQSGEIQLSRYAGAIKKAAKAKKDWKLIYLVPTDSSRICIEHFNEAYKKHPDNIIYLPWLIDVNNSQQLIKKGYYPRSMSDILTSLQDKVSQDTISQWIYKSLIEIIPDLQVEVPDQVKFPKISDYENTPIYKSFELICSHFNVRLNPIHTTIGIPFGRGKERSDVHGNCLFRVRTVKKYYGKKEDLKKNLISDIEFEIWPDVYDEVKDKLGNFCSKKGIQLKDDIHLDSVKKTPIKLMKFGIKQLEEALLLEEFENIMKEGFRSLKNR